ncbi:hypothetical protein AB6A40_001580 [Gnathostoma spinigerum]|uniref:GOLD domain-containing protein n=1 Tax=Gnathostoma spinigerum TaxID=75299 RepID=A0ABD6E5S0_9BILA
MVFGPVLCISLLFPSVWSNEYDFTIEVPPGQSECYYQSVTSPQHKIMDIDYQVINGGDLDIIFKLSLHKRILVSGGRRTDGNHRSVSLCNGKFFFLFLIKVIQKVYAAV